MEDKKFYDNIESMKRLQFKGKLIADTLVLFEELASKKEVVPKRLRKKSERTILQDFVKGLKQINQKCKVYIEMPEIQRCGNGMVREIDPKTKEPVNNEIQVTSIDNQIESDIKKVI